MASAGSGRPLEKTAEGKAAEDASAETEEIHPKPIRILAVSMGGERKKILENMVEKFNGEIELKFVSGVDGTLLRGRGEGWDGEGGEACKRAGLVYAELRKKSRKLKQGDSKVLGCALAHLRAMAIALDEKFDLIVEDNIRFSKDATSLLRDALNEARAADLLYLGYMSYGDTMTLVHTLSNKTSEQNRDKKEDNSSLQPYRDGVHTMCMPRASRRGRVVDLVWGMYGYRVSQRAFKEVISVLSADAGKLIWRRRKGPEVRPLDRILPRIILDAKFTARLMRTPAFLRMPPGQLSSTIHKNYDIRYFGATTLQLTLTGRSWEDVNLTSAERENVPKLLISHPPEKIPKIPIEFNDDGHLVIPAPKVNRKRAKEIKNTEVKVRDMGDIRKVLTVLVTTSPIPTCPSTALIEGTLETMVKFAPALEDCPMIVVCDGVRIRNSNVYRQGSVTKDMADAYKEYKARLQKLVESKAGVWSQSKLVELTSRHGFGFAVKEGLNEVETPLVLILQHDRTFMRSFNILGAVQAVASRADINYILLQTTSTLSYAKKIPSLLNRGGARLVKGNVEHRVEFGVPLLPVVMWLDSTHICKTSWYRNFVFDRKRKLVVRGGFIEDKFGQEQIADFRKRGLDAVKDWGLWLLDDIQERCVGHMHGRRAITESQREAMKSVPTASKEERWRIANEAKKRAREESGKEETVLSRSCKKPPNRNTEKVEINEASPKSSKTLTEGKK